MEPVTSYHENVTFTNPVTFPCTVNGKKLKAKIVGEKCNPVNYEFVIAFSDRTKCEALLLESGKWWVEPYSALEHVKAIDGPLKNFISVKQNPWGVFELNYEGEELLVWVSHYYSKEQGEYHSVYFNGSYQFHLCKEKGSWAAKSASEVNPKTIDERLASLISQRLENLSISSD
jgi:hypothetical protein